MIRFLVGAVVIGLIANAVFNNDNPDSSPTNVDRHALEISADSNGHFQTPCAFNGISMRCLLDTGATGVALDRRAAARIGIDSRRLRFSGWSETAHGRARIECGIAVTLQVGPLVHPEFPVCVIDSDMHGVPLLGMAFLRLHRVAMADDTLVLSE